MGGVPARHPIQNKLHGLGDGLHMLGNGLHMFDNGPHVLGKSTFGLMLHSGLLNTVSSTYIRHSKFYRIRKFVAFGILLYLDFCRIRNFVAFGIMSFVIMSFGIMLHSGYCRSS